MLTPGSGIRYAFNASMFYHLNKRKIIYQQFHSKHTEMFDIFCQSENTSCIHLDRDSSSYLLYPDVNDCCVCCTPSNSVSGSCGWSESTFKQLEYTETTDMQNFIDFIRTAPDQPHAYIPRSTFFDVYTGPILFGMVSSGVYAMQGTSMPVYLIESAFLIKEFEVEKMAYNLDAQDARIPSTYDFPTYCTPDKQSRECAKSCKVIF
jgi:hypothetical protein